MGMSLTFFYSVAYSSAAEGLCVKEPELEFLKYMGIGTE
jgi:hypothetical protein